MVVFKFANNSDDELDTCDREFLKENMEKKREPMVTHLNVNLKCTNMKRNKYYSIFRHKKKLR